MTSKVKASGHEQYGTFSIIGFLFPLIGIVIGIIFLTKEEPLDRKLGEHMIAFSILGSILWGILWIVWAASMDVNSITL